MYTIWLLAVFLGAASADVGLGYHYKVPETSYGVPSFQIQGSGYTGPSGTVGIGTGTGFTGSTIIPSYSTASSSSVGNANTVYAGTAGTGSGFNYNSQGAGSGTGLNYNTLGTTGGSAFNYNQGAGLSSNQGYYQGFGGQKTQSVLNGYYQGGLGSIGGQSSQSNGLYNQFQTSNQYQTSAVNKYQDFYNQIVQQPAQVYKHFYVHAAPEEPEAPRARQPLVLPAPQKHYKIIFIKTPTQQAPAPQLIPVPQQNEEKTIVYVLVKKPEDAQNIVLPKFEQKPPAKPEVFFIKYNNKQESQAVINNIVDDYNKGGVSTSFSGVETDYTGIKDPGSVASSGVIANVGGSGFSSALGGSGVSDGAYAVSSTSSGNSFAGAGTGVETQNSGNFGTQFSSVGPTVVTASGVDANSFTSGLESVFGTPGPAVVSTTASSLGFDASAISTSQGVPHESYGVPKFKQY